MKIINDMVKKMFLEKNDEVYMIPKKFDYILDQTMPITITSWQQEGAGQEYLEIWAYIFIYLHEESLLLTKFIWQSYKLFHGFPILSDYLFIYSKSEQLCSRN